MDLSLKFENHKLNIRAAGVIIHNNKILLHKNKNEEYYALLGGRIKLGENSSQTIKREIKEELGKEVEILNYIATIENFFEIDKVKYHEIMFVHHIEFVDKEDKLIEYTLNNIGGNEELNYEWISISKIDEYTILPKQIKDVLKKGVYPVHIINND